MPPTVVKPPAPWVVDKSKWESTFLDADRDRDGLVSGADVKQIFLQTGLAQMYLAHIWNLCDIKSTGSLNLEQFALAMHFIDQKKLYNVEPPPSLPPDFVPPSFRPSPAGNWPFFHLGTISSRFLTRFFVGMTDMATNTSQETDSSSLGRTKTSGNKEIDQISKEIADLQR